MTRYEELIKEYTIKKKEQLSYIDEIYKLSTHKKLSEYEKIQLFRKLGQYDLDLLKIKKSIKNEFNKEIKNLNIDISEDEYYIKNEQYKKLEKKNIIEFDLNEDYLNNIYIGGMNEEWWFYRRLGVDKESKHFHENIIYSNSDFDAFYIDYLLNGQKLVEKPIYIYSGYSYDDFTFSNPTVTYTNLCEICNIDKTDRFYREHPNKSKIIEESEISTFEKDNIIIPNTKYMHIYEIQNIFFRELLDTTNHSIKECLDKTIEKTEMINYHRSPEYREKLLLDKINELYQKVHGELIDQELLYSGKFIDLIRESYQLPNNQVVQKEKVVKNKGKDSVIILAIDENKKYLITFQNRISNELIVEFPSGYMEEGETVIDAAKRELLEETGYLSDDITVIDKVLTSPGIDNSSTYMVIANNCIPTEECINTGTEYLSFGLFSDLELKYFITHNIMNGAMNRLLYYSLVHDTNHYDTTIPGRVYQIEKEKLEL